MDSDRPLRWLQINVKNVTTRCARPPGGVDVEVACKNALGGRIGELFGAIVEWLIRTRGRQGAELADLAQKNVLRSPMSLTYAAKLKRPA